MLILGSCVALNLNYSGCCVWSLSAPCRINGGCYCDDTCHTFNDCCSDITDIGCHPVTSSSPIVSPTPIDTLGKKKSNDRSIYKFIIFFIIDCTSLCDNRI